MPKIAISKETHQKLVAFQALGEALAGDKMSLDLSAESLILHGMNAIVTGLWETQEPAVLLTTLQKLAARHPDAVYPFLAEALSLGDQARQETTKRRIGFQLPENGDEQTE